MSRNSSGTYTLPAGNPVVTLTTITSTWANTTMTDIANALTDSLSRTGLGSMQAGLPLFDGTSSLPGLAWGTELTSGFYRAGAGDYRWVLTTTELLRLTANTLSVSGTDPRLRLNESDAAADNRLWDIVATGENLVFRALTDALATTNWAVIARTGGTIDSISFSATTLSFTGSVNPSPNSSALEVGFRGSPQNSQSGDYTLVLSDAGKDIIHPSGAGAGDTFTIPANSSVAYPIGTMISFTNLATDSVSIAITTDTMTIAGTTTTGTRTLAQNGVATAKKVTSTSWIIYGAGLG